ncbi:diguanylate cyclase [Burkholderia contaminans FFH2055]|uniref:EAL domain-containing protein n=1 Tax=Burkholderia contaminans TaxID=488447 RepID=UPI00062677AC|nr:EAL domain-containing protein [Burkholderia contaminans]KKL35668.1 diguanylate cyclase [Burkholderia contaminans FFH2055]MEB4636811.1 EAL domain-containing protein [Burkholderia contaminans]MEB4651646.1 EAL domain-containing protein [Burkholderia contaminans]MEB4661217.1 EAL domain-containing protein [Burkholderia contaminans]MEB4667173.1 EAL domain-containing protein [Burkholderia contaminans]
MDHEHDDVPTILIIDDDAMTRLLVVETLEPEGFRVEEATGPDEGIDAFLHHRPAVVLLDVEMPGGDGFACCRRLRAMPEGRRVPIVMLTGNDDDASIASAFDAGATDFVSKPMRWKLLGYRIRYLLRAAATVETLATTQISLTHAQALAHVGNWEYQAGRADGYWSPELYRILGVDPERTSPAFERLLQAVPADEQPLLIQSYTSLRVEGVPFSIEHRLIHADGTERHVLHQAESGRDLNHAIILRGIVQDITERKMQQGRIEYLANHDALTGLPNRNLLSDRMGQAMSHTRRTGQLIAVMVLDLDRFKHVNDTFGHSIGDGLLQRVAERLKAAVRDGDTVARLGGDEFVVMLVNLSTQSDADAVAQKILRTFAAPFTLEGHNLHVTTSIGVSLCPTDGVDAETLLKTADAALYCAKERGRNGYSFYTRELGARVEERTVLENALHQAVANGELELFYQPKVDLKTGQISGVEALIRWRRPGIGVTPPDRFIPIAEETGLILPIGEWVLRTACAQAVAWHRNGFPPIRIAVNLSARQFRQQNVAELVRTILEQTGLPPSWLELELTESVLMQDCDSIVRTLRELKALGVVLSLDDFGTGYSSLSYLKDLPIDVVKIDKSFLSDVTTSAEGASLTRSIIAMAESLHMETVAEGVETEAQLSFLNRHRCHAMQGYYFSHPVTGPEIADMLSAGSELPEHCRQRELLHRTLLLVDDDRAVLQMLRQALGRDGYEIFDTTDSDEALDLLAQHRVGVIVSDFHMPSVSGVDLLQRVKALYPDIVRILLSGYGEGQSIAATPGDGSVQKLLIKPWDVALLRKHIAESFQRFEHSTLRDRMGMGVSRLTMQPSPFSLGEPSGPRGHA